MQLAVDEWLEGGDRVSSAKRDASCADGLIAHEGGRLGADAFVSFDEKGLRADPSAGRQGQVLA
jgi:hypothetical protein